jgi:hypothetical protein
MPITIRERYEKAVTAVKAQADLIDAGKAPLSSADKPFAELIRSRAAFDEQQLTKASQIAPNIFAGVNTASLADTKSGITGLGQMLADQHFDLKSNPSVVLSAFDVLAKANVWPGAADLSANRSSEIMPLGRDSRFLWPHLVRQDIGTDTAVEDFRQTAVTVTGSVERAVDATSDKAVLTTTVALVNAAVKGLAVTIDGVPNAVLQSVSMLSAFLAGEGQYQIEQALDAHVLAQIVAAAPPFGTTGTTLVDKIRNGIATMRATGANPSIVVLNPADAASLDLLADAGGYVFPLGVVGASSPLFSLRVIERIGAGTEPPYLIDPAMLGVLFLGAMRFDADPYGANFKKNLTTLRIETHALLNVRNANGARRIAAT